MNATAMDFLGKIVIYNTEAGDFQMMLTYNVTVNYVDTSKPSITLKKTAAFDSEL